MLTSTSRPSLADLIICIGHVFTYDMKLLLLFVLHLTACRLKYCTHMLENKIIKCPAKWFHTKAHFFVPGSRLNT